MSGFDPSKFTAPKPKPLPVILLLDVSGSMSGSKIQNLNEAVCRMLETFRDTENGETEIHVAVITFGNEVKLHQPLSNAADIRWKELSAGGGTPLGTAVKMAKAMIEDKNIVPSRAYRPTVILVSDGRPGDSWENPVLDFISNGRSSKCYRMAMAIGADADEGVLGKFIENTSNPLFYAENAGQLKEFFQLVTMSVTVRTVSKDPNLEPESESIKVAPATIDMRTTKPKTSSPVKTDTTKSEEQPNDGYW